MSKRVVEMLLLAASNPHGTQVSLLTARNEFGFSRATFHRAIRFRNAEIERRYGVGGSASAWHDVRVEIRIDILTDAAVEADR
jgi:hypothetical protein